MLDFDNLRRLGIGIGSEEALGSDEVYDSLKRELAHLLLKNKKDGKDTGAVIDTTATEIFFLEDFVDNYEFSRDFTEICRDFFSHHYIDSREYDSLVCYDNHCPDQTDPLTSLKIYLTSIMYKAVKCGDEYAIELFRYLYKTYYKAEYKQLKRFRKISITELHSLSENSEGEFDIYKLARIICMCGVFNIELYDRVSDIHCIFENLLEMRKKDSAVNFLEFDDDLFFSCIVQIQDWMEEESQSIQEEDFDESYYDKLETFVGNCLRRNGYPEDYVERCVSSGYINIELAETLALLKTSFPDTEFTFKEVQTFSRIHQALDALVCVCDDYSLSVEELFGRKKEQTDEEGECLFHPEKIIVEKRIEKPVLSKPVIISPVSKDTATTDSYIEEIADLKRRLMEAERDAKHFKQQYNQSQKELQKIEGHLKKLENDREELIALRNHVYNLSSETVAADEVDLSLMKVQIAERKIAIIGGHTNWINKVKKDFPNWKFFDANVSRLSESMSLGDTEKAYFFTNHLSHSVYGKYIAILRENKIPFGYLHSININNIVAVIHKELVN